MNDRSFDDRETTFEELKSFFFFILRQHLFLLLGRCFLLYTSVYLRVPYAFNDIPITYKKKKA
jgi:hypothetical protein